MKLFQLSPLLLAALTWQASAQPPAAESTSPFGEPIASASLENLRGGTTLNDMQLHGTTAANTANNVTTGTNIVSGGSFANLSGIPVVIQNTGANVLIQNAVILNLQMN